MLTIFTGPFHPTLENAFISRIKKIKSEPWSQVAVIAPSARILERLQLILAKNGNSVLNLYFFTFTTLAKEVVEADSVLEKPVLSDPLFFDTLVKIIQREDKPFKGFLDLAVPDGFPGAVRATLRDLMDAGVPFEVQEAIKDKFLGEEVDIGSLKQLFRLYQIYLKRIEGLPVLPRSALLKEATRLTPESTRLSQFKELLYYGFYDLTGIQLDFFQEVVKHHPSSLFFPYSASHPAYKFSGFFKDNFLQSVINKEVILGSEGPRAKPEMKIFNISGIKDEAWVVTREMLRLHDEKKIPYHEMAVISRNKERLQNGMAHMLDELKIPFREMTGSSLAEIPLAAMALEFLENLPARLSWAGFIQEAITLLEQKFEFILTEAHQIWTLMKEGLENLSHFYLLQSEISKEDFLETLRDRWKQTEICRDNNQIPGVSILYAEQARGLSFKVVFIVGVEERVFPRIIREDPFLRDNARLALTNTLGYKIPQKMAALDEERLIFHLLASGAEEKIYLTYQRSDEEGSVVGPSSFLRSFVEERGLNFEEVVQTIPRSYFAKLEKWKPRFQSVRDIFVGNLISAHESDALAFARDIGRNFETLELGLKMAESLQSFKNPGLFDGLIGAEPVEHFFKGRPLSPSRLEIFGLCPFKYLATQIWGLEEPDEKRMLEKIEPLKKGELVHRFFELFFKELTKDGKKKGPFQLDEPLARKHFESVFSQVSASELMLPHLLWEAVKIRLWVEITRCLEEDLIDLNSRGLNPSYFEKRVQTRLDAPLGEVEWQGIMDRIDVGQNTARVIDYKTGRSKNVSVSTAALQGYQSQPPIYLLLLERLLAREGRKIDQSSFAYLYLGEEKSLKEFSFEDWERNKNEILKTLSLQVELLLRGAFPILPDEKYCSWCEVAQICRKNDSISQYRSESGPAEDLEMLRDKKAGSKK